MRVSDILTGEEIQKYEMDPNRMHSSKEHQPSHELNAVEVINMLDSHIKSNPQETLDDFVRYAKIKYNYPRVMARHVYLQNHAPIR